MRHSLTRCTRCTFASSTKRHSPTPLTQPPSPQFFRFPTHQAVMALTHLVFLLLTLSLSTSFLPPLPHTTSPTSLRPSTPFLSRSPPLSALPHSPANAAPIAFFGAILKGKTPSVFFMLGVAGVLYKFFSTKNPTKEGEKLDGREGIMDGEVMIYKVAICTYYNATGRMRDQVYARSLIALSGPLFRATGSRIARSGPVFCATGSQTACSCRSFCATGSRTACSKPIFRCNSRANSAFQTCLC